MAYATGGLIFSGQPLAFDSQPGINSQALRDLPRILRKEGVIVARRRSAGAVVHDVNVAVFPLALRGTIGGLNRRAIVNSNLSLRHIDRGRAHKVLHQGNVIVLRDGVVKTV